MKTCYLVAGPNGAGKTTFARAYLPEIGCLHFINVDFIAGGIAPLQPEAAAREARRIFLQRIDAAVKAGKTFALELSLSGRAFVHQLRRIKKAGYQLEFYYLRLPSVLLANERVRRRSLEGGNGLIEMDIRNRFQASWINFCELYQEMADYWVLLVDKNHPGKEHEFQFSERGKRAFTAMKKAERIAHKRAAVLGLKIGVWKDNRLIYIDPIIEE